MSNFGRILGKRSTRISNPYLPILDNSIYILIWSAEPSFTAFKSPRVDISAGNRFPSVKVGSFKESDIAGNEII